MSTGGGSDLKRLICTQENVNNPGAWKEGTFSQRLFTAVVA